jgi:hypothetical protein
MAALFKEDGIRFRYPENWSLEREDNETGWTVSVQSPNTAFMMVSLRQDMPATNHLAEAVLEALREDYPDLEADDCVDSLAGQPALGHNIRFFNLDLTNTCWTRSFSSSSGTLLVLCQSNDLDLEKQEPILRAMCASLEIDAD